MEIMGVPGSWISARGKIGAVKYGRNQDQPPIKVEIIVTLPNGNKKHLSFIAVDTKESS